MQVSMQNGWKIRVHVTIDDSQVRAFFVVVGTFVDDILVGTAFIDKLILTKF